MLKKFNQLLRSKLLDQFYVFFTARQQAKNERQLSNTQPAIKLETTNVLV